MKHYDAAVIGGGILGCFTARNLRRWNSSTVLIEKEEDVCKGVTRANSAGLRPERELVRELGNPDWLHLCGNCSRVHPMVEAVINEGKQAGEAAWEMIRGSL